MLTAGARQPTGLLLVGPPGTGKTLLARVVGVELGLPFYYASGKKKNVEPFYCASER